MLAILKAKIRWLKRAIRTYKELETFAEKHRQKDDSPNESLLFFYQRKAYRAGQEDGEQHVMTHAYYWAGGEDENWEPDLRQLYDVLSTNSCKLQRRSQLLARSLKRLVHPGEHAAQL